ncbi:arginyl-tRNA synthetase [Basidiobolus meristosporus CBS 931.73]|uniref:arginine--tRNA ligase n=1 Tax=Basidiobolus meristosporus CBS 931.73 TaxID=1314790 RepID=A0A1Y1Z780_9FUNG|nr:arginyl-tRNA synthetase [Basidiobolus meristosporus CBS 931.73]|eukprot:ORY06109.1 arginyl-tRNA synthetase [Basidiobolus meristosporus CBS 931.73]
MLDLFKEKIAEQIAEFSGLEAKAIPDMLDSPKVAEHGDFAIAIPKMRLKGNPVQFAKDWSEKFVLNEYITKVTAAGPFLNFTISKEHLRDMVLKKVFEEREKYGTNKSGEGKTVIVEFSSPNIAKPFHAGHLRSTIIGNFIRNVHEANGWNTIAMNYLGDWGKQYGILAIGFERYGSEEELHRDAIKHLYDVYVKINADAEKDETIHDQARAYFKRMEDGDEEALQMWKKFRDLSIVKYKETYARLNISFDVYSGESQVNDGMRRAMALLEEKNISIESQGAKIVDLTKEKLGKVVVQKNDGTTLYITRDIGAAMERHEQYNFDAMYYVIASQQDLHVAQLFKILEKLDFDWSKKCTHINYGLVAGMSTRKGTAVFLDDMLDQTQETMHEVMRKNEQKYAQIENPEEVADVVGISAIIIQDMAARRIRNYDFDWNRMFSFEGDTGPYLQYAHSRLCSIERNSDIEVNPNAKFELLTEKQAVDLVDIIARYPELVLTVTKGFEPCNVVTYALKLSHAVSNAYDALWVRGEEKDVAEARLGLYYAARVTLGNAMRLLGLRPLERM